ncbi:transporter [Brevifollis gellanilyticus]|uniref:Transporter n=2 Tax=Brevifollis gellanilyticus TaxID=748831 RepID=A0A512MDR1_9BACT|nr:transporter [Brevifollis gellanilyticus]
MENNSASGRLATYFHLIPVDPMNTTSNWLIWALLSAVFAAATAILAKVGLRDLPADPAAFVRTLLAALFLGLVILLSGKWQNPLHWGGSAWTWLGLSAVASALSWVCYFRALKTGSVSQVAPVDKLGIALTVLLAWLFLGERPGVPQFAGLVLMLGGAALIAFK